MAEQARTIAIVYVMLQSKAITVLTKCRQTFLSSANVILDFRAVQATSQTLARRYPPFSAMSGMRSVQIDLPPRTNLIHVLEA